MEPLATVRRRPRARRSPALTVAVTGVMCAPLLSLSTSESLVPFSTRVLACFLWALGFVPALLYLREAPQHRSPIPFFPMIGVLFALYYSLPAVLGAYLLHWKIVVDPSQDYDLAVLLAFAGWALTLCGYAFAKRHRSRPIRVPDIGLADIKLGWVLAMLYLSAPATLVLQSPDIPPVLRSFAQLTLLLQRVTVILGVLLLVRRRLGLMARLGIVAGILLVIAIQFGTGFMGNVALVFLTIGCAIWLGRGHVGISMVAAAAIALLGLVLMKGALNDFRRQVWFSSSGLGVGGRATLMASVVADHVQHVGFRSALNDGLNSTTDRSANLELFADVIRRTPTEVPYWEGASYASLVGAFVPRLLWPTKPTKVNGQAFGHRYGYLSPQDQWTSFNLPVLVEMYANFGELGVLAGCLVVGLIYGALDRTLNRPGQDLTSSVLGLTLMIPLINIESDFSLTFGGLFINAVALRMVIFVMQRVRRRAPGRGRRPSIPVLA